MGRSPRCGRSWSAAAGAGRADARRRRFPHRQYRYLLWVSTETSAISLGRSAAALGFEDGACGYIGPWADLEIIGQDGRALATGQEGVIRTRQQHDGPLCWRACRD